MKKRLAPFFLIVLMCLLTFSLSSSHKRITGDLRTPLGATPPEGMTLIPAGEFQMGSNDEGTRDNEQPRTGQGNFVRESCCPHDEHFNEQPLHTVYVDAFYMDKYAVTNAQYKKFVEANPQWQKNRISLKYHDSRYLMDWKGNGYPSGKGNHPVVYVSWYAAMAYAKWAGKRLPTEAEWERAGRGSLVGKKYPQGDTITPLDVNYYNGTFRGTTPVGSYPANAYGLYDMAGNVWEWCLDNYDSGFYAKSPYRNPISGAAIDVRLDTYREVEWFYQPVLRGGSYVCAVRRARVASRGYGTPTHTNFDVGFRCVRDIVTP